MEELQQSRSQKELDSMDLATSETLENSERASTTMNIVIQKIKNGSFDGLIALVKRDGSLAYANGRMQLIYGIENKKISKCFLDYVSNVNRNGIRRLIKNLCKGSDKRKLFVVNLPLKIQNQSINLHANVIAFREFLMFKVSDDLLIQIVEIEIERLKALILECPEKGLWITDENGVITDIVEENLYRNLGYQASDVLGKNIHDFETENSPDNASEYRITRVHRNGTLISANVAEGVVTLSDGSKRRIYVDSFH